MVNFPKIFANLAKVGKATIVAGVSVVQAHPVVAACTVVVIVGGLTFYYYKNKKNKEKEDDLKYSSGNSTGEPENTKSFFYDPHTKSVTDVPPSITSDNIRQRQKVSKSASFTAEKSHTEVRDEKKSNLTISKGAKTAASGDNRNIDDGKISPGNNVDSDMSGEEKVIQYLNNVSQTDSTASTSHSMENLDENCVNLLVNLIPSNQGDVSFEDISISSDTDVRSGSSVSSVLSGESDWCRTCNNPVNTRMLPCNHRYLCHDCAGRILRIYKKCKICRSKIERYCVELSSFE